MNSRLSQAEVFELLEMYSVSEPRSYTCSLYEILVKHEQSVKTVCNF